MHLQHVYGNIKVLFLKIRKVSHDLQPQNYPKFMKFVQTKIYFKCKNKEQFPFQVLFEQAQYIITIN